MINVILNGACGRLGTTFQKVAKEATDVNIVAGVDVNRTGISTGFPLYKNIKNVAVPADAVVDFSTPAALDYVLDFCVKNNTKLLVATTGHSEIQNEKIAAAAKKIAVFKTANLSHGVYVLSRLVALAASLLDGFDVNAGLKDAKVTQKAGVITVYDNGDEAKASKYYTADDFTIFVIEDKDDVSTVTAKKLANDYEKGGLNATIYGVMNSNDEYTALYIVK